MGAGTRCQEVIFSAAAEDTLTSPSTPRGAFLQADDRVSETRYGGNGDAGMDGIYALCDPDCI
jgi:hypothetical protein